MGEREEVPRGQNTALYFWPALREDEAETGYDCPRPKSQRALHILSKRKLFNLARPSLPHFITPHGNFQTDARPFPCFTRQMKTPADARDPFFHVEQAVSPRCHVRHR